MKKALSILLTMTILVCALPMEAGALAPPLWPEEPPADSPGSQYFEYEPSLGFDGLEIVGYTGSGGEITLPAYYDGKPVVEIRHDVFKDRTDIVAVTIPDGYKRIYYGAFENCTNLESINLAPSVECVERAAFDNTAYFNNEENWENDALYIGSALYKVRTTYAGDFAVKEGTTIIADLAFADCHLLGDVTMPDSVVEIGALVFWNCTRMKNIQLSKSLVSIQYGLFSGCTNLQSIQIPDSVTAIMGAAFYECTSLKKVHIPDSVSEIWISSIQTNGSFENCTALEEVTFGGGLTKLPYNLFAGCTGLTTVVLPEGLKEIASGVFKGCASLNEITLPDSVAAISETAFDGCEKLENVWVDHDNHIFFDIDGVLCQRTDQGNVLWCYPQGRTEKKYILPTPVEIIAEGAFANASVEKIDFSPFLRKIRAGAFVNCALKEVAIPSNVESIGLGAFQNCAALEQVQIDGYPSIWYSFLNGTAYFADEENWYEDALYVGDRLICVKSYAKPSIVIKEGTRYIAESAFQYSYVEEVVMPDSVERLGDGAFYFCERLKKVTLSVGLTAIPQSAFYYCRSLTDIAFPDKITQIGDHAFWNCDSLEVVVLPSRLETIGNGAFGICDLLKKVEFSDGLHSVGDAAFTVCPALTEVILPDSVHQIGSGVFNQCTSLAKIHFPENLEQFDESVISGCSALAEISLPAGLEGIDYDLFRDKPIANNPKYWQDGVMYIDGYLIKADADVSGIYTVQEGTTTITKHAFTKCKDLEAVILPNSVISIDPDAFSNTFTQDLIVHCNAESEGYRFAKRKGFEVVLLEGSKVDIDQSGAIDVADIMKLKSLIMADEWSEDELYIGDLDASGALDVGDIMAVKNIIMSA